MEERRNGPSMRTYKSICEQKYHCKKCDRIVFATMSGALTHKCSKSTQNTILPQHQQQQQLQLQTPFKCQVCKGQHKESEPCYIQPLTSFSTRKRKPRQAQKGKKIANNRAHISNISYDAIEAENPDNENHQTEIDDQIEGN